MTLDLTCYIEAEWEEDETMEEIRDRIEEALMDRDDVRGVEVAIAP